MKRLISVMLTVVMMILMLSINTINASAKEQITLKEIADANGYEYYHYAENNLVILQNHSITLFFYANSSRVNYKTHSGDSNFTVLRYPIVVDGEKFLISKTDLESQLENYFPNLTEPSVKIHESSEKTVDGYRLVVYGRTEIEVGKKRIFYAELVDAAGNLYERHNIVWSFDGLHHNSWPTPPNQNDYLKANERHIVSKPTKTNKHSLTVEGKKVGKVTITIYEFKTGISTNFDVLIVDKSNSYVLSIDGGYDVELDKEFVINYAIKQGEEYVHNDIDIEWEIESKNSKDPIEIISDKEAAYTRALTIKGIEKGECELVIKSDGVEIGRTKIEVKAEVKVFVDGSEVKFDQPPVMKNDRVLVPIRKVAEKMGDTVKWNGELSSALIIHPDRMVVFKNNSNSVKITKNGDLFNWSSYSLDVPAQIINGRTLTPVRAIGECLGVKVTWDAKKYSVYIETDKNVKKTVTSDDVTNLNKYYSARLDKTNFSKYSADINSFFDSRTNTWGDAFLMWWDDWWLGIKNAASGEKNDVYMMKNALAEVLAEMPESGDLKANIISEIKEWTYNVADSASDGFSLLEFINFNTLSNGKLSLGTANALSKFGKAAGDAGLIIQVSSVGIDTYLTLFSDYTVGITYIDAIRNSMKNSNVEDEEIYEALDELEKEYTDKAIKALSEASENGTVILGKTILSIVAAPFNIAEFAKSIGNLATKVSNDADAVKTFYSLYCFNSAIDKAYNNARKTEFSSSDELNTYIQMFNIQKGLKTKLYQSMDQLRNKKDAYTKERIDTVLGELGKVNMITFE